jgi:hypothetical protein
MILPRLASSRLRCLKNPRICNYTSAPTLGFQRSAKRHLPALATDREQALIAALPSGSA